MVMQLADGGELYDRLTTEGFALDDGEIRSLLRDAADALGFLHDRSIVHGDVKPENLLLTASDATAAAAAATSSGGNQAAAAAVAELREEAERRGGGDDEAVAEASEGGGEGEGAAGAVGKVLLADFGSSFRMRGDGGRSGMKTVKEYTVAYSAPEVVDHSPEISAKADVWSLGVIAYVMVRECKTGDLSLFELVGLVYVYICADVVFRNCFWLGFFLNSPCLRRVMRGACSCHVLFRIKRMPATNVTCLAHIPNSIPSHPIPSHLLLPSRPIR